ncbi:hypothetical protein [Streptacidiphilus cavernicola]|uniref:PPPDE domain-containing protein n=1 Tax=Streptacidiphilus cavernicola TaxID=3342716 RepID=A0ABV6VWS3_9ACTN
MRAEERTPSSAHGNTGRAGRPSSPPSAAALPPLLALQQAAGNAAVTRAIQRSRHEHGHSQAVQRMESPPRGRRGSGEYEADASASESEHGRDTDSSPERRQLHERIDQELAGGPDLVELTERLAAAPPAFGRIRRIRQPDSESESRSEHESESPEREKAGPAEEAAAAPAEERLPELPENRLLVPLRDLLTQELRQGGLKKKLKVTLMVDGGDHDPRTGNVGHAWIEVTGSRGQQVSFGFYPTEDVQAFGDVRGGVMCPDRYGHSTHHESKTVSLRQIVNGYQVTHDRAQAAYNLTQHNCTTFAGEVWKAMTGKEIPRNWLTAYGLLGAFVATPHGAAEGITSQQEARLEGRRDRMRSLAGGPAGALIPGGGDADERADRMARANLSQSSPSESSEELD